jgi:epoxyqueuosine reductase
MDMLKGVLTDFGFDHFGCTRLEKPLSLDFYKNWLDEGLHASMDYLVRHLPSKENPQLLAPRARSAIVVAKSYFPHPYPVEGTKLRTALYAQGEDYHLAFKGEIENLAARLREKFPGEEFLCFTDSSPILERDLAYRAGLGWIGKNTCTIHQKHGSLFFLGEIYTSLDLQNEAPLHPDLCGTCDRCLRACPTGAIEAPKRLNAGKCISYWTIEAKEAAPEALRAQFGDWFFGCDICQTVCPWNEKVFGREEMQNLSRPVSDTDIEEDLRWVLKSSNREISRRFERQALERARPMGLKRNALYIIANLKLGKLKPEVEAFLQDEKLGALARWTLSSLESALSP